MKEKLKNLKSLSTLTMPPNMGSQYDCLPDGRTGTWKGKRWNNPVDGVCFFLNNRRSTVIICENYPVQSLKVHHPILLTVILCHQNASVSLLGEFYRPVALTMPPLRERGSGAQQDKTPYRETGIPDPLQDRYLVDELHICWCTVSPSKHPDAGQRGRWFVIFSFFRLTVWFFLTGIFVHKKQLERQCYQLFLEKSCTLYKI